VSQPVPRPFPQSICHGCAQLRLVVSGKQSTFLMCKAPELPKYPRQPVAQCAHRVAAAT
jgi:hypothetical protein